MKVGIQNKSRVRVRCSRGDVTELPGIVLKRESLRLASSESVSRSSSGPSSAEVPQSVQQAGPGT